MILLDAMMQIYRANYKLSDLMTRDGKHTGMEFGFLKSLEALRRFFKDEIIICWEGKNNFRFKIDSEYKANRRERRKKEAHQFLTYDRINEFRKFLLMIAENNSKFESSSGLCPLQIAPAIRCLRTLSAPNILSTLSP